MDYFKTDTIQYLTMIGQHLTISIVSVLIASIIGIIIGILCHYLKKIKSVVVMIFSAFRIIPSLSLLFILVPYVGVGILPTIIALTFLAIPPILLNTIEGLNGVDKSIIEAARGMGFSNKMLFYKIKFPLAFPTVFSGIKTSSIEVVASATLASYIGGGGLGDLIFTGLGLMRFDLLWIGGLTVAFLSLSISFILNKIDKYLRKYERH